MENSRTIKKQHSQRVNRLLMKDKTPKINKIVYFQVISARAHYRLLSLVGVPK